MTDRQTYVALALVGVTAFVLGLIVSSTFFKSPKTNACVVKLVNGALYVPGCEYVPIVPKSDAGGAA